MLMLGRRWWIWLAAGLLAIAAGGAHMQLPAIGAGALLHPARRPVTSPPPGGCEDSSWAGDGVTLRGWQCAAANDRRGTLVYLHGVADNRMSAAGLIRRFLPRGFDVIAYDSRAHGESDGEACTYGFHEKRDLRRVLDHAGAGPIVLLGTSLGAAVALQAAADDRRIAAVVAAETFSDLRTVVTERAPFVFTQDALARAFRAAEERAAFHVDAVSPLAAARRIGVPVLLVHGANDVETPPDHSRRVFAALAGPKRLMLVPGAGHNKSLAGIVWDEVEAWIGQSTVED